MTQHLTAGILPEIRFNETRTIFEGREFALKQHGGDEFIPFMKAFFNNYSRIHRSVGTLNYDIQFEQEQKENYLLQPASVCLTIERNGEVAFTQMVAKRDEIPMDMDIHCELNYAEYYNAEVEKGNTLYFFGKGSANLNVFPEEERKTMIGELQALIYYVIFSIARRDNCVNMYSYINRFMQRSMQKLGINYHKITPFTMFRGIDYVGVNYTVADIDAIMNDNDFVRLVGKYFK
jgi:hypothetical protein